MDSKKIISFMMTAMLMCSTTVFASSESKVNKKRIYGSNRYETSIKVSKEGWSNSDYVIICRGDNFADTLCSGPIAKKYNAPILLIGKDRVTDELKNELKRLNANKIFIIGGEGTINKEVEKEIKNLPNVKEVNRLGGKDRYETSKLIAENIGYNKGIFITSGAVPADALSVTSIAANKGMPIILASKDKNLIQNYVKTNKVNNAFIIGGEKCVSKEIENVFPKVERIFGKDRYETNEKIIKRFSDSLNFNNIYMALAQSERGDEFADALLAAALSVRESAPIVLVGKDIYKGTEGTIKSKLSNESTIVVIGGEKLIPENIVDKLIHKESTQSTDSNKSRKERGGSGHSSKPEVKPEVKPTEKNVKYTVVMEPSFPGAFTYDLKVSKDKNGEILKGYQLIYDGKVIAEDKDQDGIVKPLTIFFGKDTDKSKFKILKDEKEIKFNGLNK